MTLLTRLEDSEEGLMGVTKDGQRIHLGAPLAYSAIHSLRTSDSDTATKRKYEETEKFEQEMESAKNYIYFNADRCTDYHTEDIRLRRWFGDDKFVRNYSVKFTYLQFERKKEEAFQRQGEGYSPDWIYDQKYVKVHRTGETK